MAEHSDLISEMPFLEKLNTEERLKLARKRRQQQLKKWSQREKEYGINKRKKQDEGDSNMNRKKLSYKVHFVGSVMLLEAATRNDVEEVKRLLMLGVSPDSTNEDGLTALHQCCIDNCEEMMLLLIEFGANVNAKDSEQWTPLHAAATCGHLHLIKILIERGADLLAVNADLNMAYDISEDEQTLDYIESEMAKRGITQELIDETRAMTENQMLNDMRVLVTNGYDLNFKDEQGATPLHIAASNGYMSVVEFLLDHNASTEECDDDFWQPIHAAACWGHIDVIELLVQSGADLDAKTKNGETPFDICEDPELKSRILQLRNEIESKRHVSSNRLRRSHSQNTRSHSIRRTSIREKSQIAKREAIEEARIWHEKSHEDEDTRKEDEVDNGEVFCQDYSRKAAAPSDSPPIDLHNIDIKVDNPSSSEQQFSAHQSSLQHQQQSYSSSAVQNNHKTTGYNERSVDSGHPLQNAVPVSVHKATKKTSSQSVESSYYTNYYNEYQERNFPGENGVRNGPSGGGGGGGSQITAEPNGDSVKVEIHVTVNTNANNSSSNNNSNGTPSSTANAYNNNGPNSAGTLNDLKKQRSEKHRTSLGNAYDGRIVTTKQPPPMEPPPVLQQQVSSISSNKSGNNARAIEYQHQHVSAQQAPPPPSLSKGGHNHSKAPSALFESPPSPSNHKKKFRGTASELIGEEEKKGCCSIC